MKVHYDKWRINSRDIWRASKCQHCTVVSMAVAAGVPEAIAKTEPYKEDVGGKLPVLLGQDFENLLIGQLKAQLGDQLIEVDGGFDPTPTSATLLANPIVITQAFLEKDFGSIYLTGFSDLLVREDHDLTIDAAGNLIAVPSGIQGNKYTVWDIKHSGEAKPHYKLQVGAYLEIMRDMGIASERNSGLVLRSRECAGFDPQELVDDYLNARQELFETLESNPPSSITSAEYLTWHCDTKRICETIYCEYPKLCAADRVELDMLTQISGIRQTQITKLENDGWSTITELAEMPEDYVLLGFDKATLDEYRLAADVIHWQKQTGKPEVVLKKSPDAIRAMMPPPHPGDLFFDLEWYTPVGEAVELQYLFGVVDRSLEFTPFVAHDFEGERRSFEQFVNWATEHLKANPGAHIYHFNNPEVTYLRKLATRHAFYDAEVEALIDRMFDLYPLVKSTMISGYGSNSIKVLEHFYDPKHATDDGLRGDVDVTDGADSQLVYYKYLKALEAGKEHDAELLHEGLLMYNKADCESTLFLRNWLHQGLDGYRMAGDPPFCPTCGEPMKIAVYGMPSGPLDPNKYATRGCVIIDGDTMPRFVCDCDELP